MKPPRVPNPLGGLLGSGSAARDVAIDRALSRAPRSTWSYPPIDFGVNRHLRALLLDLRVQTRNGFAACDVADLSVRLWRSDPSLWGLRGHEHPDHARTLANLTELVGRELVEWIDSHTVSLTNRGMKARVL